MHIGRLKRRRGRPVKSLALIDMIIILIAIVVVVTGDAIGVAVRIEMTMG